MKPFSGKFTIIDGILNFDLMALQKWASKQESGSYSLSIGELRHNGFNKIFHVLVKELKDVMYRDQGETWSMVTSKYMLKILIGFYDIYKNEKTGEITRMPKDTHTLSGKAFTELLKYAKQAWFNHFEFESKTLMDKETREFLGI